MEGHTRNSEVNAAYILCDMIKTGIGVRDSIKCILDDNEVLYVRETSKLLQILNIEHPIGQFIVSVCQSFYEQHGSGVKTLLYMIGMFLRVARCLIEKGIPLDIVTKQLKIVLEKCCKKVEEIKVPFSDTSCKEHNIKLETTITECKTTKNIKPKYKTTNHIKQSLSKNPRSKFQPKDDIDHSEIDWLLDSSIIKSESDFLKANVGLGEGILHSELDIGSDTTDSGFSSANSLFAGRLTDFDSTKSANPQNSLTHLGVNTDRQSIKCGSDSDDEFDYCFEKTIKVSQNSDASSLKSCDTQLSQVGTSSIPKSNCDSGSRECTTEKFCEISSPEGVNQSTSFNSKESPDKRCVNEESLDVLPEKEHSLSSILDRLKFYSKSRLFSQNKRSVILNSSRHCNVSSDSDFFQQNTNKSIAHSLENCDKDACSSESSADLWNQNFKTNSDHIESTKNSFHELGLKTSDLNELTKINDKPDFRTFDYMGSTKSPVLEPGNQTSDDVQLSKSFLHDQDFTTSDDEITKTNSCEQDFMMLALGLSHGSEEAMKCILEAHSSTSGIQLRSGCCRILCIEGYLTRPPVIIPGVVLQTKTDFIDPIRNPVRAVIINGEISHSYRHVGYKKTLQSSVTLSTGQADLSWINSMAEIIDLFSIQCLIGRGTASVEVTDLCLSKGVIILEKVPYSMLEVLSDQYNVTMATYITDIYEANLFDVIIEPYSEDWMLSENNYVSLRPVEKGDNLQTIILSHPSHNGCDLLQQEYQRCHDVLASTLTSGYVLPGYAKTEEIISQFLTELSDKEESYMAVVYEEVAKGFYEFVQTVHYNVGSIDRHDNNQSRSYEDLEIPFPCDVSYTQTRHIVDDYATKLTAWRTSLNTVITILETDTVIISDPSFNSL